jgi:hypothetical protein
MAQPRAWPHPMEFDDMWIAVVALSVLVGHGLGHAMAPQAAFAPPGAFPRNSVGMFGDGFTIVSTAGKSIAVLWLLPLVGFLLGTYGLWTGQSWWRPLLGLASVASIVVVLPWWRVMPTFSYIGALAVDVAVLVGILTPLGDQILRSFGL